MNCKTVDMIFIVHTSFKYCINSGSVRIVQWVKAFICIAINYKCVAVMQMKSYVFVFSIVSVENLR